MPKIKEVYEYNNGSWENGTPIGADASNVDVALSDSTSTRDLQSVLGNVSVSDSSIKTQLSGKVDTDSGDIKDTVVSVLDPSSATDTSEDIDSTDVIVAAGEDQTTMWSKFNTFRKRVSNKFSNFLINSVEDVLEPSDTKTYSQAALNSYFADVIGYKTDEDVASIGSVADQLSTLNNNVDFMHNCSSDEFTFGSNTYNVSNVAARYTRNIFMASFRVVITTASSAAMDIPFLMTDKAGVNWKMRGAPYPSLLTIMRGGTAYTYANFLQNTLFSSNNRHYITQNAIGRFEVNDQINAMWITYRDPNWDIN